MAEPKREIDELMSRFLELCQTTHDNIDEFTLKSFERDAEKLLSSDPMAAHGLLGMINTNRRNFPVALNHLKIAAGGNDVSMIVNYSAALSESGLLDEAIEQMKRAHQLDPTSEDVITRLAGQLDAAGRFQELNNWFRSRELNNIDSQKRCIPESVREVTQEFSAFLEQKNISDDQVAAVVSEAIELLADQGYQFSTRSSLNTILDMLTIEFSIAEMNEITPAEVAVVSWKFLESRKQAGLEVESSVMVAIK